MSILLILNDKCFYFQILLFQGCILWIFYRIYFNKTNDIAAIHALNIAEL